MTMLTMLALMTIRACDHGLKLHLGDALPPAQTFALYSFRALWARRGSEVPS